MSDKHKVQLRLMVMSVAWNEFSDKQTKVNDELKFWHFGQIHKCQHFKWWKRSLKKLFSLTLSLQPTLSLAAPTSVSALSIHNNMDRIHNNMVPVHHSWFSRIVSPSHPFSHSSVCFWASHLNGQKQAYSQALCERKGWCAHLETRPCSCVCVKTVPCVCVWCLVYSAESAMSSIWCQPKRRAAITNEDRWQGSEATSCEHCKAYVCVFVSCVKVHTACMCLAELHPIPTFGNLLKTLYISNFVFLSWWRT